jgi:hypothetical protein
MARLISQNVARFLCFLSVALLPACSGSNVSTTDKFAANDPEGMVVIGAKLSRPYGGLFSMHWCLYDEVTRRLSLRRSECLTLQRGDFAESDISVARSEAHYFVNKLKPGIYGLSSSDLQIGRVRDAINYVPTTVAFKLGAGEVIYVGTFSFDIPEQLGFFARPTGRVQQLVLRDDGGVRNALSRFSGITVDMKFVPVQTIQVDKR